MANRFVLGAVGVAAVLGATAGVVLAVAHEPTVADPEKEPAVSGPASPTGPPGRPSAPPSRTGEQSPTATSPALEGDPGGPLYASGNVIHDGVATIRLKADKAIEAFGQGAGGYVVSTRGASSGPALHELWYVQTDKLQKRIATLAGDWDLSSDGRSVVGRDPTTHLVTVWDVSTGNVVAQWNQTPTTTDRAVFVGSDVYVTEVGDDHRYALVAWDYQSDTTRPIGKDGMGRMTASPFGKYLAGVVGPDGHANPGREDTCAAVRSTPLADQQSRWFSCQWSRAVVNANGDHDKVLLTAAAGDGETRYAVTDAATGPDQGVIPLHPSGTVVGAHWGTSRSVLLSEQVQGTGESGAYQLEACELDGSCAVVARGDRRMIPPLFG